MIEHTSNGQPTRYAVIDGKRVRFDYAAARVLAQNAHLLAPGNPKRAAEVVAEAERAEREQITARVSPISRDAPRGSRGVTQGSHSISGGTATQHVDHTVV